MFPGPSGFSGLAADGSDRRGESRGSDAPGGAGAGAPDPDPQSAATAVDEQTLQKRTRKKGGKRERRRQSGVEQALQRGEELWPTVALARAGYTRYPDAATEEYVTHRSAPPPARSEDAPPVSGAASSSASGAASSSVAPPPPRVPPTPPRPHRGWFQQVHRDSRQALGGCGEVRDEGLGAGADEVTTAQLRR